MSNHYCISSPCKICFPDPIFPMLTAQKPNMDFECIHCGEIDYRSNHWEACKKHPARKIINELVDEIEQLESQPNLGLATTAQLIDELAARARIGGYANYRTIE